MTTEDEIRAELKSKLQPLALTSEQIVRLRELCFTSSELGLTWVEGVQFEEAVFFAQLVQLAQSNVDIEGLRL